MSKMYASNAKLPISDLEYCDDVSVNPLMDNGHCTRNRSPITVPGNKYSHIMSCTHRLFLRISSKTVHYSTRNGYSLIAQNNAIFKKADHGNFM